MYPIACACGVDPIRYWEMTYREIKAAIDAYQERQKTEQERLKAEMQIQAVVAYRQAHLIGAIVARVLGDKHKLPSLDEAFPGIFPEEMLRPKQQDWRVMKARIEEIRLERERKKAEQVRKRGEKRGDDDRGTSGVDHRGNPGSAQESGSGQETA